MMWPENMYLMLYIGHKDFFLKIFHQNIRGSKVALYLLLVLTFYSLQAPFSSFSGSNILHLSLIGDCAESWQFEPKEEEKGVEREWKWADKNQTIVMPIASLLMMKIFQK